MANVNTIDRIQGAGSPAQGKKAAPTITLVTTTEKLVLDQTGSTATVVAVPAAAPTLTNFEGLPFRVRASFKTTTGGSSTSVVNMYVGSTIVSGNKLASITSQSLATASASGYLEANCIWDSVSGVISGWQQGCYGTATPLASTALTNTAIAVTALSGLTFCISATNGSSVTGTTFTLVDFCLEAV